MRAPRTLTFVFGLVAATANYVGTAAAQDQLLAQDHCAAGGGCFCTSIGWGPKGPDNRCGTVEDFQRIAKIACLQADAIENKTLPESLVALGRCYGAKIAAEKVGETQRRQAADHRPTGRRWGCRRRSLPRPLA
jgi:hypothetical protein